jgi:phosphoribosylamine--glycine ligase
VVLADGDYPGAVTPGKRILGVSVAAARPGVSVFHMGTKEVDGHTVTAGGRVLCVVALGRDLQAARDLAYEAAGDISFDGMRLRTDIGWRELTRPATETLAEAP